MSGIIVGILIVCVGVYFYKKFNKKSPCCKSKQNDSTTVNTDKAEVFEELKNTVDSTGEIEIIGEVKSTSELETISENKREEIEREIIGEVKSIDELETISENKREEIEREIKEINIKKLDVTTENLPDIIEMYRPNEVTMETIKNLAKDIYNKQVEPLAYSTIYKYIADSYGYRTWKDFKKVLETK